MSQGTRTGEARRIGHAKYILVSQCRMGSFRVASTHAPVANSAKRTQGSICHPFCCDTPLGLTSLAILRVSIVWYTANQQPRHRV
jgi:hypothetical protein